MTMIKTTVKVKIAVSVDPRGEWCAAGWSGSTEGELHSYTMDTLENGERRYWIEAELEVPTVQTVAGSVSSTHFNP